MNPQKRLSTERKVLRTGLTKVGKKIDEIAIVTPQSQHPPSTASVSDNNDLQFLINEMSKKFNEFELLDRNYALTIDDEIELTTELTKADEIRTGYAKILQTGQKFLFMNSKSTNSTSNSGDANTTSPNIPASNTVYVEKTTPLVTKMPEYDGNPLKWQTFWDLFNTKIHSKSTVATIDKFTYLVAHLEGDAAAAISGFALTDANYSTVIDRLKHRFGQPRKVREALMNALINLPGPTNTSNLQQFSDRVENYLRSLESLGTERSNLEDLLIPIIWAKIPNNIKQNLIRTNNSSSSFTLDALLKTIEKEIEVGTAPLDLLQSPAATTGMFVATTPNRFSPGPKTPVTPAYNNIRRSCVYCTEDHAPVNCTNVTELETRRAILQKKNRCWNCTGTDHGMYVCRSGGRCLFCQSKHHSSICPEKFKTTRSSPQTIPPQAGQLNQENKPSATPAQAQTVSANEHLVSTAIAPPTPTHQFITSGSSILLQTAVVHLSSETHSMDINILFDTGAQRTFIKKEVVDLLKIGTKRSESMEVGAFGNAQPQYREYGITDDIFLSSRNGDSFKFEALITETISNPICNQVKSAVLTHQYLQNIDLAHPVSDVEKFDIHLLIGCDYYWDLVGTDVVKGNGPTAVKSRFGYLLSGPIHRNTSSDGRFVNRVTSLITLVSEDTNKPKNALSTLKHHWDLENIGVNENSTPVESNTNNVLKDYQARCISFDGKRYTAKLPFRPNHPPLPSNSYVCEQITRGVVRRLGQHPEKLQTYAAIFQEQENRGFIERLPPGSRVRDCHYLAHHPVYKNSNTTAVRAVFNCSFKKTAISPSLNDCLESYSPDLNEIPELLLRFRLHGHGITADIEKAFLNIILHPDDRDYTRFYWLSNPTDPESPFVTFRFQSILFGATTSPFILNAVLHKLFDAASDHLSSQLKRDIYVDNIVTGVDSDTQALEFYRKSRQLLMSGGFNLRSWASDCNELIEQASLDAVKDTTTEVKVLGMIWNTQTDTLQFPHIHHRNVPVETKASVLSLTAQAAYDPIGLATPVTIRAKCFIQDLWEEQLDWNTPLPANLSETWKPIAHDLCKLDSIHTPRRLFNQSSNRPYTVHIFVDSSLLAYGTCAYLDNGIETVLVMSRARVVPLKNRPRLHNNTPTRPRVSRTLPELELTALLLGVRLSQYIYPLFKPARTVIWSDSQIALHWVNSSATSQRRTRYSNSILSEIHRKAVNIDFRYCPSEQNPSDCLTRGQTLAALHQDDLFHSGPTWLLNPTDWPKWQYNFTMEPVSVLLQNARLPILEPDADICLRPVFLPNNVIDITRFGHYWKLVRVTAYVLKWRKIITKAVKPGALTVREIAEAETKLVALAQKVRYNKEMHALRNPTNAKLPLCVQLDLTLEEDVLKCGGRLDNALIPDETKHPILLPRRHPLTTLIIQEHDHRCMHAGPHSVVTALRQRYWIPSIREEVKRTIHKCVTCRRVNGPPYRAPPPAPLQAFRVKLTQPFATTGVDLTGALLVKSASGEVSKVYVVLFTCATTRNVHLEITPDLSAASFLRAFRRFCSRRSLPSRMISDNATNFTCTADELQQLLRIHNDQRVSEHLSTLHVEWVFIPKRAPWFGGFWERLIGITKQIIRKVLGRALVTYDELVTIVTEVEAVVNDRPLTPASANAFDEDPLTPSKLMYGRRLTNLPRPMEDGEYHDPTYDPTSKDVKTRDAYLAMLLSHFRRRFATEYLTSLREYHSASGSTIEKIKVGDVVQVHADSNRINWKLAVVERLNRGADNRVRSAEIRTNNGRTNRPITRLYPLEVSAYSAVVLDVVQSDAEDDDPTENLNPDTDKRPKRDAALRARTTVKNWIRDLQDDLDN